MKNLQYREVEEYIRFRLLTAGMSNGRLVFSPEAQQAIYEYSDGIPRLINMVCDKVLIHGYLQRTTAISREMVEVGVLELEGGSAGQWKQTGGVA